MKKIYVITGFHIDWADHFILHTAFTNREDAERLAKETTHLDGFEVRCFVTEVEVKEDN